MQTTSCRSIVFSWIRFTKRVLSISGSGAAPTPAMFSQLPPSGFSQLQELTSPSPRSHTYRCQGLDPKTKILTKDSKQNIVKQCLHNEDPKPKISNQRS